MLNASACYLTEISRFAPLVICGIANSPKWHKCGLAESLQLFTVIVDEISSPRRGNWFNRPEGRENRPSVPMCPLQSLVHW